MNGLSLLVAVAALAVDFGWDTGPGGQLWYTIRIEPEFLKELRTGEQAVMTPPLDVSDRGLRRFQVIMGSKGATTAAAPARAPERETMVQYGWRAGKDGGLEYLVQMTPERLETLASGVPLICEVDTQVPGDQLHLRLRGRRASTPKCNPRPPVRPAPRTTGAVRSAIRQGRPLPRCRGLVLGHLEAIRHPSMIRGLASRRVRDRPRTIATVLGETMPPISVRTPLLARRIRPVGPMPPRIGGTIRRHPWTEVVRPPGPTPTIGSPPSDTIRGLLSAMTWRRHPPTTLSGPPPSPPGRSRPPPRPAGPGQSDMANVGGEFSAGERVESGKRCADSIDG